MGETVSNGEGQSGQSESTEAALGFLAANGGDPSQLDQLAGLLDAYKDARLNEDSSPHPDPGPPKA